MATQAQEDLTALDGPDDWVSLFLNDVGDQLIDSEVSTVILLLVPPQPPYGQTVVNSRCVVFRKLRL